MSLGANPSKTCIHSSIHPSIHLLTYSIYSSKEHQPQKHDEGKTNNELHHENCCCYDLDENSTENFSTACPRKNIDQSKISPTKIALCRCIILLRVSGSEPSFLPGATAGTSWPVQCLHFGVIKHGGPLGNPRTKWLL